MRISEKVEPPRAAGGLVAGTRNSYPPIFPTLTVTVRCWPLIPSYRDNVALQHVGVYNAVIAQEPGEIPGGSSGRQSAGQRYRYQDLCGGMTIAITRTARLDESHQ